MTAETMMAADPGRGDRMSRRRKRDAVLHLLRAEDLEAVSRTLVVTAATLSAWRDAFPSAGPATRAPEGNGHAECFMRTLKENLPWLRSFDTVEEPRQALLTFRDTCNTT